MVARRTEPMERSNHADAIFEADLFVIDGRVWMIGGCGKSQAAEMASGGGAAALGYDSIAIIRDGDTLYGRFDPGALPLNAAERERRHGLHKLDAVAYCLSESDSMQAYADRRQEIAKVDNKMVGWMLSGHIYPARWAPFYFEPAELARLLNHKLRIARFLELTEDVKDTRFLVLPWMARVEAKAALYVNYGWQAEGGIVRRKPGLPQV